MLRNAAGHVRRGRWVVDVTKSPRMDPGGLLLLKHTGVQLARLGWEAYVRGEGDVMMMLSENLEHFMRPKAERAAPQRVGDYLLRGITSRDDMVGELEEWAKSVRTGTTAKDEHVALWQMQICEVTTNSFQHCKAARTNILIAGRAYSSAGVVQLAALDLGIGIARVIEKSSTPIKKGFGDGDLLAHACKKGITSHCVPENQGAGLDSLVNTVKKNEGGRLQILSNRGLFHVNTVREHSRNLAPKYGAGFDGTLTVVTLGIR